ncbi:MAG TPA: hypothetical protein VK108_03740 [Pseudogracilibacillus sp.]|nr:hypothetical protein [Pseudogracilibacillus sp.]
MSYIMKQAYKKVIREINSIELKKITETRYLYLYKDRITTKYREFPIQEVIDLSFKKMQDGGGLLFLHTDHGVYSYHVPSSPSAFIAACKDYIKEHDH